MNIIIMIIMIIIYYLLSFVIYYLLFNLLIGVYGSSFLVLRYLVDLTWFLLFSSFFIYETINPLKIHHHFY